MKPGEYFTHKFWLDPDYKTPLLCVVTAVRRGTVYWRPSSGGKSMHFPAVDWNKYTKT